MNILKEMFRRVVICIENEYKKCFILYSMSDSFWS